LEIRDPSRAGLFPEIGADQISLATFLMDEQENPAVVQAIMRHAKMDMTLYYSHSSKKAKRAAVENYAQRIAPELRRVPMRVQQSQAVN
jgi:hypothetical protein